MSTTPLLERVIGSRLVRRAADAGFLRYAHARARELDGLDAARKQRQTLLELVRTARRTRFGRDHRFAEIGSVADYQAMVPLGDYESFWSRYWQPAFPRIDDLT
ncbi:MAG TPA: GH3 auxin-responsive promoter family protein, partial [Gemmataceae bacterium]